MNELILHHYPPSPVSERVRLAFGIKALNWGSVEVPRLPPRPKLFPMTGGYRRVPVLQAGADIYCDSTLILDELERRHPQPSLFPDRQVGLAHGLARWVNGPLFESAIAVVLGANAEQLPEDFARDRVTLYFGADARLDELVQALPAELAQLRVQLAWLLDMLDDGRDFFCGAAPGFSDATIWYLIWFLVTRYGGGRALIDDFPALAAWYRRVEAIGHGRESTISADDALALCARSQPQMPRGEAVRRNPEGLAAGARVSVVPTGRDMDPPVSGELVALDETRISVRRDDGEVGAVLVHFPRVAYRLAPA